MKQPAEDRVERIVIVGGGTAGWMSAAYLAARLAERSTPPSITLIEAPDIPTVGVGEGSWPTMRETLATIGISEAEFLTACDASFKQGSRFDGWTDGTAADRYYHPFSAPVGRDPAEAVAAWAADRSGTPFAALATPQVAVCAHDLAPRQRAMPDYAGALNYGYHFDAGRLATLLRQHAVDRLGVTHLSDTMVSVEPGAGDDIAAVVTRGAGRIAGDLFIDCTGHAARLIGGDGRAAWIDRRDVLFNDRALVVQQPVAPGSAIASQTIGTAHEAGWIWDIGLPGRRGIGCVYSSRFIDDERAAAILSAYLADRAPGGDTPAPRLLSFPTGHRDRFWIGNCLAIGLSAGFVEPLEASAIVLIELSLRMLADNFPASTDVMPIHAGRFNALFRQRWDRIVDFLKLHYSISRRTEPYWQAHRDTASVPPRLAGLARLWKDQPPSAYDFPFADELFPAASHQYVYYGMGGVAPRGGASAAPVSTGVGDRARSLVAALPTNRAYLDALRAASAPPSAQKVTSA